jgi:hypothetical protein
MSKQIHPLPTPLLALSLALLLSLTLLASCGTGVGSSAPATPTAANITASGTATGDKARPETETSGTATPIPTIGFDCASVNEIPSTECEALVALYNSTNGPDWVDNSGWLATDRPCSWSGIECTNDHVHDISLSYNQLSGVIPAELGNLVQLYALYLSHNQLSGVIPATLGRLSQLSELDLSYNQLGGPVPEFIAQISGCSLWGNQLDGTITANGHVPFTVDTMGVHFSADPSLANSIWPEVMPATPLPDVLEGPSYWLAIPEHIRFTFSDPSLSTSRRRMGFNLAAEAQILVFPRAELVDINPLVQTQMETLRNLLAERGTVPSGELPLLPLTNSAQVFHAQAQYLVSGNLQGLRFISQHSQDPRPIMLSQELFYTFQGFTDDGVYYVAAFFPVTTTALPDTIAQGDWHVIRDTEASYASYLLETTAVLEQLPPAEFTPDLTLLDAVVTSLIIDGLPLAANGG